MFTLVFDCDAKNRESTANQTLENQILQEKERSWEDKQENITKFRNILISWQFFLDICIPFFFLQ